MAQILPKMSAPKFNIGLSNLVTHRDAQADWLGARTLFPWIANLLDSTSVNVHFLRTLTAELLSIKMRGNKTPAIPVIF